MSGPGLDHGSPAATRRLIAADFAVIVGRVGGGKPMSRPRTAMMVLLPATQCALLHRIAHRAYLSGWRRTAAGIAGLSARLTGAWIHPGSRIGPGLFVPHPARIHFCGTAGAGLVMLPQVVVGPERPVLATDPFPADAPRLGEDVVVGAQSVVLGPVTVGDGALVGVGVTTLRDVPAGTISVQVLRQRSVPQGASEGSAA